MKKIIVWLKRVVWKMFLFFRNNYNFCAIKNILILVQYFLKNLIKYRSRLLAWCSDWLRSYRWGKVFKSGLIKFCGRQPLKKLNFFKRCFPQNLLSPLRNTSCKADILLFISQLVDFKKSNSIKGIMYARLITKLNLMRFCV